MAIRNNPLWTTIIPFLENPNEFGKSQSAQSALDDWYNKNFPGGMMPSYGYRQPVDAMQMINPMYTRQQKSNVDPIAMYRTAKETGVIPQSVSNFQPYTPPAQSQGTPFSVSRPVLKNSPQGGK